MNVMPELRGSQSRAQMLDLVKAEPKALAFVLPQFHRIAENDAWWGEGFTEWTNVRRAKPLFSGHLQPRVPVGGRYYDLCDVQTQAWQADLARAHGIHGFCYYHYWFNGRRLLERPVNLMLERGQPDFPFCLAWANEPWTRTWDGGDRQILMPQDYGGEADWRAHFDELLRAFKDPRYICVDGKPVFLIYRSASIPECAAMLAYWRSLALAAGLPGLHLVQMLTAFDIDARGLPFDAAAEFEPMFTIYHGLSHWDRKKERLVRHRGKIEKWLFGAASHAPNSFDYGRLWRRTAARPVPPNRYPGAFVDWDNSARRGLARSIVFRGFRRELFEQGFASQFRKAVQARAPFLFINAWNEWAEGAYLEPDEARGAFFLEAIRRVLQRGSTLSA